MRGFRQDGGWSSRVTCCGMTWREAPGQGLATLGVWLEGIQAGRVNPKAEGKVGRPEFAGTAILDGEGGIAPLILARAGEIARDKARDTGVGLVRVQGLGELETAGAIAAEVALGPFAALIVGPRPSWALALPASEGLPVVLDSALRLEGSSAKAGGRCRRN